MSRYLYNGNSLIAILRRVLNIWNTKQKNVFGSELDISNLLNNRCYTLGILQFTASEITTFQITAIRLEIDCVVPAGQGFSLQLE